MYQGVGRLLLDSEMRGGCIDARVTRRTAFVIAGGHVLTAQHCSSDATQTDLLWLRLAAPGDEFGTVDLPVRVVTSKGFSTTVVEGRGTEMSEGGMVLYAGILLNPGDLLEIEFDTPTPSRMPAIVRSRNGFCFGLEFIIPLPA